MQKILLYCLIVTLLLVPTESIFATETNPDLIGTNYTYTNQEQDKSGRFILNMVYYTNRAKPY